MPVDVPSQSAALAIPAVRNKASELATTGLKNLDLLEEAEELFRLVPPPHGLFVLDT